MTFLLNYLYFKIGVKFRTNEQSVSYYIGAKV